MGPGHIPVVNKFLVWSGLLRGSGWGGRDGGEQQDGRSCCWAAGGEVQTQAGVAQCVRLGPRASVFTCTRIYIGMTRPVSTGTLTALFREEVRVGGRVPQIPEGPRLRKHQKIGSSWCTDGPELVLLLQLQCGLWLVALGSP